MAVPAATEPPKKGAILVALGVLAVAAAVTIAVVVGKSGGSRGGTTQVTVTPISPIALSASGLKTLVGDLNQRVYWLGPVAGDRYELTRTTSNYVFVRYLPPKVKVGTKGKYLFVATYPLPGALASLKAAGSKHLLKVAGGKGGLAGVVPGKPTNYRVAFPHVDFQIEVYDPKPKNARKLATSGDLTAVP